MPYVTIATSSKQIHSSAYWKLGFYDEPTLVHLGTQPDPPMTRILESLKCRQNSPLPKEMCLHWECSLDVTAVVDLFERHGYSVTSYSETPDRCTFLMKSASPPLDMKGRRSVVSTNGHEVEQSSGDFISNGNGHEPLTPLGPPGVKNGHSSGHLTSSHVKLSSSGSTGSSSCQSSQMHKKKKRLITPLI
jgi:hypothetical protein